MLLKTFLRFVIIPVGLDQKKIMIDVTPFYQAAKDLPQDAFPSQATNALKALVVRHLKVVSLSSLGAC